MLDDPGMFGDDFEIGEEAAAYARDWRLWAILTPLVLAAGLWVIWRTRVAGPTQFDANLPSILYDRLQRWGIRLGLAASVSDTPYEQGRRLGRAVPEGQAPIASITEAYVQYRFGGHDPTGPQPLRGPDLREWQTLQPILWRAWVAKLLGRRKPGGQDHYTLVEK